ncbi:MAG: exosortase/archaeosortase family protein [Chloroflexi bacterium]|nr:exosortase/archaeosortase family protein [Chloroflexota bacterium]
MSGPILLALLPSWLAMAWLISKAQWFWNNRPDLQFGWVVLMLSAYLIWDAWEQRPLPTSRWNWASALLGLSGLALLFLVQIYQAAFGMMAASLLALALGVMLLVAANLSYVFGWSGLRHFAFGFGFLLIALPMPTALYNPIVSGLQSKVAAINVEVLNIIGIPAQQVGSLIHLPNGTVGIDEACSGIRSLQSTIMATLFIGYLTLRNKALQIALFVVGMLLAITGNVIRSFFLSYMANEQGLASINTVHDAAGWSILAFTAVGVMILSWFFARLEKQLAAQEQEQSAQVVFNSQGHGGCE